MLSDAGMRSECAAEIQFKRTLVLYFSVHHRNQGSLSAVAADTTDYTGGYERRAIKVGLVLRQCDKHQ
jgi:hypothetical protein